MKRSTTFENLYSHNPEKLSYFSLPTGANTQFRASVRPNLSITSLLARRAWTLRVSGLDGKRPGGPLQHEELLDLYTDQDEHWTTSDGHTGLGQEVEWLCKQTHSRHRVDQLLIGEALLRGVHPIVTPLRAAQRTRTTATRAHFRETANFRRAPNIYSSYAYNR